MSGFLSFLDGGIFRSSLTKSWRDIRMENFQSFKYFPFVTQVTMAKRKLKTVGKQQIYSPGLLSDIDPVWSPGPVPAGFWDDKENRQNYMIWLCRRLGYTIMQDLYRLQVGDIEDNHGRSALPIWAFSPIEAVKDAFPDYQWHEWLFALVPKGFWLFRENRRRYLEWLMEQLGFQTPEAMAEIRRHDILTNHGSRLFTIFSSITYILDDSFPKYDWGVEKHPPLSEEHILDWADAYHRKSKNWPTEKSGKIRGTNETWSEINDSLTKGLRGLPGGSSLSRLLQACRGVPPWHHLPRLTESKILKWADRHYCRKKRWPTKRSGTIENSTETWEMIDLSLREGLRGLPGGESLLNLLKRKHNYGRVARSPKLTEDQILAWADTYYSKYSRWPASGSGLIDGTNETWRIINQCLRRGDRGLPGGSSLAKLLEERRGKISRSNRPRMTETQILAWADAFFAKHGRWPMENSGIIEGTDENWRNINQSLNRGDRGLPGGTSLSQFLEIYRGKVNSRNRPRLTERQIITWADAYYKKHGCWPTQTSGTIEGTEESWKNIHQCLSRGSRGLPGRSSLAKLLEAYDRKTSRNNLPRLTVKRVLAWADAYHRQHGRWPTQAAGMIEGTNENWRNIEDCLRRGNRGLPGGSSLAQLLESHRDRINPINRPKLTEGKILAWADAHYEKHGRWPSQRSGRIEGTYENWQSINECLRSGLRGLPGGSSLAKLLDAQRRGPKSS